MCPSPETICKDPDDPTLLSCSFNKVCGLAPTPTPAAAPTPAAKPASSSASGGSQASSTVPPTISLYGPALVTLAANQAWAACVGGARLNCDLGAKATQSTDGDINSLVK